MQTGIGDLVPTTNKKYYNRRIHSKTDFEVFEIAQRYQKNVLLFGPTGGGKTMGILAFCAKNKIPYKAVNMNGGTSVEEIIGAHTPSDQVQEVDFNDSDELVEKLIKALPSIASKYDWKNGIMPRFIEHSQGFTPVKVKINADGEYVCQSEQAVLVRTLSGNRGIHEDDILESTKEGNEEILTVKGWNLCILCVEEINFSPVDLMSVWFSILDARREIVLGEHHGEVLKAGPGLMIMATMNPDYIGTNKLNRALVDRFPLKLTMDYDKTIEHHIMREFGKQWNINAREILFIKEFVGRIRETYKSEQIETNISTRMIEEYIEMMGMFGKLIAKDALINSFEEDDRTVVVEQWKLTEGDEDWELSAEDLKELKIEEFEGLTDDDKVRLRLKEDPANKQDDDDDDEDAAEMTDEQIAKDPKLKCPF